jgi:hypothetical protein
VNELRPGLWHWQAPHPEWTADEHWPHDVSSYAIDDGTRLLLIDPLAVPEELRSRARDRITAEQAGDGSPDLAWLRSGGADVQWYTAARQPGHGIEALEGREHNDLVLWIDSIGAVISGDTLVDFGQGFRIADWLRSGVTRDEVAERLRPLLDRQVEFVLPTHGTPTNRAALERALA